MKMRMQTFGEIEVEGERYDYDLVIEQGGIRKRSKKPSKAYRSRFGEPGHTSLYCYECVNIGLKGILAAGSLDGRKVAGAIHGGEFETVYGPVRFDEKGDVLHSPYVIWRVRGGKWEQMPEDSEK